MAAIHQSPKPMNKFILLILLCCIFISLIIYDLPLLRGGNGLPGGENKTFIQNLRLYTAKNDNVQRSGERKETSRFRNVHTQIFAQQ